MTDHCRLCHNTGRIYDGHASDYTPGAESWSLCGCRSEEPSEEVISAPTLGVFLANRRVAVAEWDWHGWTCLNPEERAVSHRPQHFTATLKFAKRI